MSPERLQVDQGSLAAEELMENATLEERKQAETELAEQIRNGKWFEIPTEKQGPVYVKGLEVEDGTLGKRELIPLSVRKEMRGTYSFNEDVLAIISKDGRHLVRPTADNQEHEELVSLLTHCGYERGNVPATFSAGELPTDEKAKEKWEQLVKQAEELGKSRETKPTEE